MSSTSKYVARSFMWGGIAKIIDAGIKFASVPLLLIYFGKSDFALIALAMSVNAYLNLLDMGVNTGAIKYFSEWIAAKEFKTLDSVARTSISFYGIIGLINAILLVLMAFFGMHLFAVNLKQVEVLHNLFLILALFAVVNWSTSVFNQLLTANEDLAYIQQVNIIRSVAGLVLIFVTMKFKFHITIYFTLFTLINSLVVFPFFLRAKNSGLVLKYLPAFDWVNFSKVFKYSLAIIAIGIFSVSATKLRPIVLGLFSDDGIEIVADFRILETITLFIVSIGGMFISIFLPKTSKLLLENNKEKIANFAYDATLFTSIICTVLCFPFILCGQEVIQQYVGAKYLYLTPWLTLWVGTILFYLHNSPIASLVLSTGKTKILMYISAFSCIVSLVINAVLCKQLGAGSAVLGFSVYILIQMLFYYFYFNEKVLNLNSFKVFKTFIVPSSLGFVTMAIVWFLHIVTSNLFLQVFLKCGLWLVLYAAVLFFTKVIDKRVILRFIPTKKQQS